MKKIKGPAQARRDCVTLLPSSVSAAHIGLDVNLDVWTKIQIYMNLLVLDGVKYSDCMLYAGPEQPAVPLTFYVTPTLHLAD